MNRCVLMLAAGILGFAGLGDVRSQDILRDNQQREQVLAQKWARDVSAALEIARKQDPASARETLSTALAAVKSADGLSDVARADFTRRLQGSLASLPTTYAQAQNKPFTPRPSGPTPLPSTYPSSGSPAPGGKSVSDQAKSFIDNQNKVLGKTTEARDNRASSFSGAVGSVQNSPVLSDKDMILSAKHNEIVARRTPQMNPKEEAVMKGLMSTVPADFSGMNFRQVLDFIVEKTGLVIIPDQGSLKEMNVEYDDPVNFKLNAKVTVRTVLRKILADRGLSYTISEGTVNIVTVEKARAATVVRIYPINDLVTPVIPQPQYIYNPYYGFTPVPQNALPPGTPGLTPTFNQTMGQTIAEMVRTSVDPQYWAPAGPGMVTFNEATGSLIVRASAEVHWMVNSALYRK